MEKKDSIITYIDYGYIKFDIKPMMEKRGLSRYQIVKKTGIHYQVIERYIEGTITRYDKDVLAKLCYILDCDLMDIITYVKPTEK